MDLEKHGLASVKKNGKKHFMYDAWSRMRQRCTNPKSKDYCHYGGRGISVCARWEKFSLFLEDMGERPKGYSLDRIDNDKPYSPENCRWSSQRVQVLNSRLRKNKTSRYRGVGIGQNNGRWIAKCGGKYIGSFKSEREAAAAYNDAAKSMFCDDAVLNNFEE